jgi:hypothetical protein
MDRFVIRQNIKHYVEMLERTTEQKERAQILTLLAEERRKQKERDGARRAYGRTIDADQAASSASCAKPCEGRAEPATPPARS